MAKCHPQESTQNRHGHHQAEVEQSHVLMKRHKADVPKIRNPHGGLAEDHDGVHVNNEDTKKHYCRPPDNVAERPFRPEILP